MQSGIFTRQESSIESSNNNNRYSANYIELDKKKKYRIKSCITRNNKAGTNFASTQPLELMMKNSSKGTVPSMIVNEGFKKVKKSTNKTKKTRNINKNNLSQ